MKFIRKTLIFDNETIFINSLITKRSVRVFAKVRNKRTFYKITFKGYFSYPKEYLEEISFLLKDEKEINLDWEGKASNKNYSLRHEIKNIINKIKLEDRQKRLLKK